MPTPTTKLRCRCCNRVTWHRDAPICTGCISRHWGKHARGIQNSRCREFKSGSQSGQQKLKSTTARHRKDK